MRVAKFRVERYRSIEQSKSLDLSKLTVLVGPNNEGKSNILRALVVGLEAIRELEPKRTRANVRTGSLRGRLDRFESYDWSRDFPKNLQEKTPNASSVFELEFDLDSDDLEEFKTFTGHSLNGELKLRALLGRDGRVELKVVKRGPGSAGLNSSIGRIATFVSQRVRLEYISTERTSEQSQALIRREVATAWRRAQQTLAFQAAATAITEAVSREIAPLENRILDGVREFYPDVAGVSLQFREWYDRYVVPSFDILVDDGSPTALSAKGDGVQSLVALSLVRALTKEEGQAGTYVLAIEEPEAHLHPGAVHQLSRILNEIATTDQVILTTHSPIFVNRTSPRGNILVNQNRAAPASSLAQVRDSLGVELPDNLTSADLVLLVEGVTDVEIVGSLLSRASAAIAQAYSAGRFQIRPLEGAANAPYYYRLYRDSACAVHVLLDGDREGKRAHAELEKREDFVPADVTVITLADRPEGEMEDLFDENVFVEILMRNFNVRLDPAVSHREKRFSLRMQDYFTGSGVRWTASAENNLKRHISEHLVSAQVEVAPSGRGVIDALVRAIEAKLSRVQVAN